MKLSKINPLTLPSSPEVEHSVLCSFIIRCKGTAPIIGEAGTKPDFFHIPANRAVFESAMELWTERQEICHLTVTQRMKEKGTLKELGAKGVYEYLNSTGIDPTDAQLKEHLLVLQDLDRKRKSHLLCVEYAERSLNGESSENLVAGLVERGMALLEGRKVYKTTRELVMESINRMEEAIENRGQQKGVQSTGFTQLDATLCGGMRGGDYILISAPTKGGKSILAHNIAEHVAVNDGKPVLIFSLEMPGSNVIDRMIASRCRVDFTVMRNGWMDNGSVSRVTTRTDAISRAPLIVRDDIFHIAQITSSIRQFRNLYPEDGLIIIDYGQLIDSDLQKNDNREVAVAKISTQIRRTANQLNIPIVVLLQENDDGRARESRRWEQDCTTWIKIQDDDSDEPNSGTKKCIIKLNRNGPTASFCLSYQPHFLRLNNLAQDS